MAKDSISARVSSRQQLQPSDPSSSNERRAATGVSRPDSAQMPVPIPIMIMRSNMETWNALSRPAHFAQRRTDFAAATPWFHGVQTGFWSTNAGDLRNTRDGDGKEEKYCTGLYIAGCPPVGRYVDSEVVITSINGAENKKEHIESREREMRNSLRRGVPVGIAVSKDATKPDENGVQTFPCAIPEGLDCVVLGWFLPTLMWPKPVKTAKGENRTVWMVRLEKIALEERSWWSNARWANCPHPSLEERDFETKAAKEICLACGQHSVRLFKRHFVCLNKECPEWFLMNGEHVDADLSNITYHHDFLNERFNRVDEHSVDEAFHESYPNLYLTHEQFVAKNYPDGQGPPLSVTPENLAARNEALLAGFSCPQCGLANSRVDYHRWHCRNTDCRDAEGKVNPFSYHAPPPHVTPGFLEDERKTTKEKADKPLHTLPGYLGNVALVSHVAHEFGYDSGCRVTMFRPRPDSLAMELSNILFRWVQMLAGMGELGLARRTVSANGGTGLTNHFVENFGERYKLPFALGNNPIAQAPEFVQDALNNAILYMWEYFGPEKANEWFFNELYVAAYLSRKMHMSFHDDGEKNLGPVIGTWTLGGHATFKLCIKPQYDYGRKTKDGAWMEPQEDGTVDPIPTGCTEEAFRKELKARFERGEIDGEQWSAQLQEHMDAYMADPTNKRTYTKRTLVSFNVQHGDLLIMWGPNTQRFMEHAVECKSPMRFAITLRRVTGNMATDRQWEALDRRLANDKAFTPSWAGQRKDEVEGEREGEREGEPEPEPEPEAAGTRATRPRAKRARVEEGDDDDDFQGENENEGNPAEARVTRSKAKKANGKERALD